MPSETPRKPQEGPGPQQRDDKRHPDEREHEGATEDEVTPTTPPQSPEYDDEPKQG